MAGVTLAQAEAMLALYLTAEEKVLLGQSYSIGDRALTRADLRWIVSSRKEWEKKVAQLSAGRTGPTTTRVLPRDD